MTSDISRRRFLSHLSAAAAALPFLSLNDAHALIRQAVPGLSIGYSAITWGGNDTQAIKEIASLGFRGIQLRANILKEYGAKPEVVKDLLKQNKLELAMFSSGNANVNTGDDEAVIRTHVDNARFVKAAGGRQIQVTNSSRPKSGMPDKEDLKKYGKLLNEIGKRTRDIGVQTTYHNHMHQLGETPEEVDIIMDNCQPENVKLLLDVAHYHQGGGDSAKAIRNYRDRLRALHLKDVKPKGGSDAKAYTFVELGQGNVDLSGVFKALQDIKFKGWGIIELDAVPEKEKTPLQCAEISRAYLQSAGVKI